MNNHNEQLELFPEPPPSPLPLSPGWYIVPARAFYNKRINNFQDRHTGKILTLEEARAMLKAQFNQR